MLWRGGEVVLQRRGGEAALTTCKQLKAPVYPTEQLSGSEGYNNTPYTAQQDEREQESGY